MFWVAGFTRIILWIIANKSAVERRRKAGEAAGRKAVQAQVG